MKKAVSYIGIIMVSVTAFFVIALATDAVMDALYYNTGLIDWLYDSDLYSTLMIGLCLVPAFEAYSRLKKICDL